MGSSYYVAVDVTTTQGMSVNAQSSTFTVSIDTPTLGEATVVNNACDGYISVTSNLSSEYGGSGSGEIVSFETDSENVFTKLQVDLDPIQSGSGTPSPSNVRPIIGTQKVNVLDEGKNLADQRILLNLNPAVTYTDEEGYYLPKHYDTGFQALLFKNTKGIEGQMTLSFLCKTSDGVEGGYLQLYYTDGTRTRPNSTELRHDEFHLITIVSPADKTVDRVAYGYYTANKPTWFKNVQLELGAEATDYVPYIEPIEVSQEFDVSLTPTVIDKIPYNFKITGDVRGDRLSQDLIGGTICWNQHLGNTFYGSNTVSGITITADNTNKTLTVSGTAEEDMQFTFASIDPLLEGHVYYMVQPNGSMESTYYIRTGEDTFWSYRNIGKISVGSPNPNIRVRVRNGKTVNFTFAPQLFDLTQMFGSTIADYIYSIEQANAGAGVAWFKKLFPKPYYAYNAGELMSVNTSAHNTVGFNAWDEEWEVGNIDTSTGLPYTDNTRIRSKNYNRCVPNTSYYFTFPESKHSSTGDLRFSYYDADKNFIGHSNWIITPPFTTPSNAYYYKFNTSAAYGTTYNNDICINISDPTINGKYFPYEEHTYPLGDVELRGIPKLDANNNLYYDGDTYESDGSVTRIRGRKVFDGTENWQWFSSSQFWYLAVDNATTVNAFPISSNGIIVKVYASNQIRVYPSDNPSITSETNMNTIFPSGSSVEYTLATPTTETTDPFEQIQEVSKYGTLEYITNNDIPVGHNTTYLTRDVFGGYVDLVSGRLVVTHKMIDFPTTGWTNQDTLTNTKIYSFEVADMLNATGYWGDIICDQYETIASSTDTVHVVHRFNQIRAFVSKASHPTVSDWQTYLANLENVPKVWYPLAEPLTYQLTPQQIQTLVGTNNVWSEQGDIELSYHIPITNLLVKRQDVDDVSGNWLTLYSQPITQASDMDFTFIDFTNQYGKTYKYALVPLLTQTQSGVEVEVEGGYTVSDEVQSIFDGVFIADQTGSQKCKANVGYGNVDMNQTVGTITPIGAKYPVVITNSKNQYHNGSISGTIVPDDYYFNGNLSRIDMVNKRDELEQFLTNKRAKIIKDWNGKIWLVMIMDNVSCTFNNNYGMGIVNFSTNWVEVGDPTNQQDLQATGLINVGGV